MLHVEEHFYVLVFITVIAQLNHYINLIVFIIDGNLVFSTKYATIFLTKLNEEILKNNEAFMALNNYWLSGFADVESCFTASVSNLYSFK